MGKIYLLDATLQTPEENLALDEALLEECHAGGPEVLRFWESPRPFVVLGLSGRVDQEICKEACRQDDIPILRRISGGGTVLQGPGCLSYTLVLSKTRHQAMTSIEGTHAYILDTFCRALRAFHPEIRRKGISDLAIYNHKISGNAHRRLRHAILFHGTLLYNFPLALMERYLRMPSRQPTYREERPHISFVRNLKVDPQDIKRALAAAWGVEKEMTDWPRALVAELVGQRYALSSWNIRDRDFAGTATNPIHGSP